MSIFMIDAQQLFYKTQSQILKKGFSRPEILYRNKDLSQSKPSIPRGLEG